MTNVLSMADLAPSETVALVERALDLKRNRAGHADELRGKSLLMLFSKPSMRTRLSFDVAMAELGGHAIAYDVAQSTLGQKETFADFGAVASRYVDAIVARLYAQRDLELLASRATVPVVNGLTDDEHPCQALGDLVTIAEHVPLGQARLAYVGDARNNVTHSLLLAAAQVGMEMRVACPATLAPRPDILVRARDLAHASGARLLVGDDPHAAARGADFVYTDTWMSYHVDAAEKETRRRLLEPYRVDDALMKEAPGARFMHCLPATRGDEVTDDVLDGASSLVLDQAENRLHAQKALLLHLLPPVPTPEKRPGRPSSTAALRASWQAP